MGDDALRKQRLDHQSQGGGYYIRDGVLRNRPSKEFNLKTHPNLLPGLLM